MKNNKIIFITGGARSGKSFYALKLASSFAKKTYIATAEVTDEEMKFRIEKHKKERDQSYETIEEPVFLAGAIRSKKESEIVIVDCLTLWLSNLFLRKKKEREGQIEEYLSVLPEVPGTIIIISNELGMGVVPENKLAREFRDEMGLLNQKTARLAHEVYLMASGIPIKTK